MIINTSTFGELDVQEEKLLTFKGGIPGFEDLKRYVIIVLEQTQPFMWLQAIDEDISLPVLSPFDMDPGYSPIVDDSVLTDLEVNNEEDLLVLVVSVIPQDVTKMTANMAAPILVNIENGYGMQVLAESGDYQIRQPIFDLVSRRMHGG